MKKTQGIQQNRTLSTQNLKSVLITHQVNPKNLQVQKKDQPNLKSSQVIQKQSNKNTNINVNNNEKNNGHNNNKINEKTAKLNAVIQVKKIDKSKPGQHQSKQEASLSPHTELKEEFRAQHYNFTRKISQPELGHKSTSTKNQTKVQPIKQSQMILVINQQQQKNQLIISNNSQLKQIVSPKSQVIPNKIQKLDNLKEIHSNRTQPQPQHQTKIIKGQPEHPKNNTQIKSEQIILATGSKANLQNQTQISLPNIQTSDLNSKMMKLLSNRKIYIFDDLQAFNIHQLYTNSDESISAQLVAYVADSQVPLFVKKQFKNVKDFQNEKAIYNNMAKIFPPDVERCLVQMESFNDEKQDIYFSYGKCNLLELTSYYKSKNQLIPNQLIMMTFKVVAQLIYKLFEKGYYYTNTKPENLIFELNDQVAQKNNKPTYYLKLSDLGSLSSEVAVSRSYTPQYFLSQLALQRKTDQPLVKFGNKQERLYNEFYTLLRTIQKILIDNSEQSKALLQEYQTPEKNLESNQKIVKTLQKEYQQQIDTDRENGKTVQKIFDFLNKFITFQQDLGDIQKLINEIKVDHFEDKDSYIQTIVKQRIQRTAKQINPLEMILTFNCNAELYCSSLIHAQSDWKLEEALLHFLNNDNASVYLLMGKSGSGKTYFLRKQYSKLLQFISAKSGAQHLQVQKENKIQYQFRCKFVELNQFASDQGKSNLQAEIKEFMKQFQGSSDIPILFLDGLDEFGQGSEKLLDILGLKASSGSLDKKIKIIVSARSNVITEEQLRTIFGMKDAASQKILAGYICSMKSDKVYDFLKKVVSVVNMYKDSRFFDELNTFKSFEEYKCFLESNKSLTELDTEPLTLRFLVSIMPELSDMFGGKASHIQITQYEIIQAFVNKWMQCGVQKLNQDQKSALAKLILDSDSPDKLTSNLPIVVSYLNAQALNIVEYMWLNNLVSNNSFTPQDVELFSKTYSLESKKVRLIMKCLPIVPSTHDNMSFTFVHQSIVEYYLAHYWIGDLSNKQDTSDKPAFKPVSEYGINAKLIKEKDFSSLRMLADFVLAQANRVASAVKKYYYGQIVYACLYILEQSKGEGFTHLNASSNALTILNFIRFQFSGLDLQNIKTKNAYLEMGIFQDTNLSSAQIEDSSLVSTDLSNCNLYHATLKNIELGLPRPDLIGHEDFITSIAISTDNKFVVSGSVDKKIKIWDLETRKEVKSLNSNSLYADSVAISPNGKLLVTGDHDKTISIWEIQSGQSIKILFGHSDKVTSVAVRFDNQYIISGSKDKTVRIWNPDNSLDNKTLSGHTQSVKSVAVTYDGRYVVSGSKDGIIKIWNFDMGTEVRSIPVQGHSVKSLALTSDSRFILAGVADCTVKLLNFETGKEIRVLQGHSGKVNTISVYADGNYVVSGSSDNSIRIWNLETGVQLVSLQGHNKKVKQVALSPNGKYIVSCSKDKAIKVWKFETEHKYLPTTGYSEAVQQVAISPDGKYIVSRSNQSKMQIWNMETGMEITTLAENSANTTSIAITSDSKYIVAGNENSKIKVLDFETGALTKTLSGHNKIVTQVAVSPDSRYLASASLDQKIKVWSFDSGLEITTDHGNEDLITSIVISSDSKYLLAGSIDGKLKKFNYKIDKQMKALNGSYGKITSLAISVDCKIIIIGSKDCSVKLAAFDSGLVIKTLAGHSLSVNSVAISSDGKFLIAGSDDKTMKMWDVESGIEIRTLTGHTDKVNSVYISADNKKIVSGSQDKTIKIWDLEENPDSTKLLIKGSVQVRSIQEKTSQLLCKGIKLQNSTGLTKTQLLYLAQQSGLNLTPLIEKAEQ